MINISKQSQKDSMITLMSMNNVCFIGLIILRSGKMEQWRISYLMKKSIIITDRQLSEPMINWMKSQAGQEEEYYEKEAEGEEGDEQQLHIKNVHLLLYIFIINSIQYQISVSYFNGYKNTSTSQLYNNLQCCLNKQNIIETNQIAI